MVTAENLSSTAIFKIAVPKQAALNIRKAVEFYEQNLGFSKRFEMDDYAAVGRGSVEIHLWQCDDKYIAENTACRINVEGIDVLYQEYEVKGIVHPHGKLVTTPWGTKEFTVLDLDGNGITFCEAS